MNLKKVPFLILSVCYAFLVGYATNKLYPSVSQATAGKKAILSTPSYSDVPLETPKIPERNFNHNTSGISLTHYRTADFTADVLFVSDPKRVSVAVTKYLGAAGQTVTAFVRDNQAIAGINGGAFDDPFNWRGTGGEPYGLVIVHGQWVNGSKSDLEPIIGFTQSGKLIAGTFTDTDLRNMDVTEALSFGPVLVKNGVGSVQGGGGWGYAPRTAIGQKQDGTVILVVTDGRHIHGPSNIGASLQDLQQLMLYYGAVTAANLDGGSSATMVFNGKLVNEPANVLGQRMVSTAIIVK